MLLFFSKPINMERAEALSHVLLRQLSDKLLVDVYAYALDSDAVWMLTRLAYALPCRTYAKERSPC